MISFADALQKSFNPDEARDDHGRWVASGALSSHNLLDKLSQGGSVPDAAQNFANQIKNRLPDADVRVQHWSSKAGDSSYVTARIKEPDDSFSRRRQAWEDAKGTKRGPAPNRQVIDAEFRVSDHDTGARRASDYVGHLSPSSTYADGSALVDRLAFHAWGVKKMLTFQEALSSFELKKTLRNGTAVVKADGQQLDMFDEALKITKYNPNQPRDNRGRFAAGGVGGSAAVTPGLGSGPKGQRRYWVYDHEDNLLGTYESLSGAMRRGMKHSTTEGTKATVVDSVKHKETHTVVFEPGFNKDPVWLQDNKGRRRWNDSKQFFTGKAYNPDEPRDDHGRWTTDEWSKFMNKYGISFAVAHTEFDNYFGNKKSFQINEVLRHPEYEDDKMINGTSVGELRKLADGLLANYDAHAKTLEEKVTVYRVVDSDFMSKLSSMKKGDVFTDKGFVSTTLDTDFKQYDHVEMQIPAGTKVIANKSEWEVLLRPSSRFKIIDVGAGKVTVAVNG